MRSLIHDTFGEPGAVLHVGETKKPEPAEGQVLVRTLLAPIHNHDLVTVSGTYGYKPELPAIGGSEAAGIVEAVGDGVDEELVGKRVVATGIRGAWAEYFTVPAAGAVMLPDAIPDELGCQLVAMPFSAITLLEFLNVKEGDWVVQTAANGAVGKIFAALAKARGVNVLGLVRRDEAVAELDELGIGDVISTDAEGWKDKARAILGEGGARAAIDSVGGRTAADLADLLGEEGLLVTFGSATMGPMQLPSGTVIFKHLTVKGFWTAKVGREMSGTDRKRLIGDILKLAGDGSLKLPAGGIYQFDDVAEAVKAAQTAGREGKILLKP